MADLDNSMDPDLMATVAGLYGAFRKYKTPQSLEACPNCATREELDALCAAPLRTVGADVLQPFAVNALTTHWTVPDWKHFLPRILELLPGELSELAAPEMYVSAFGSSDWRSWPEPEQRAIEAFFTAFWRQTLMAFPSVVPVNDALCSIAQAEDDIGSYLECWRSMADEHDTALRQLIEFYYRDVVQQSTQDAVGLGAFWGDRQGPMTQALCWLFQDATRTQVEDAGNDLVSKWGAVEKRTAILAHWDVWHTKYTTNDRCEVDSSS